LKATCVITSIFAPTPAVASFAAAPEFDEVLIIGDRKSPATYALEGVRFVSLQEQLEMPWCIARSLPQDHYARKMIGYLEAAAAGADILFDTDDDNRLVPGRSGDIWNADCRSEVRPAGRPPRYVNVYRHFTRQVIWPRGLPLECVLDPDSNDVQALVASERPQVGIWQGLADGDPDVDAIYRLTNNQACIFQEAPAVSLAPGVVCPFNSQNTAFARTLLPLMYLPAWVTFRYTDILRGLVAQPILWAAGLRLCFTSPTVFQDRNAHNYLKDFESEVPMYLTGRIALETAMQAVKVSRSVPQNLHAVYEALESIGVVTASELTLLEAWLEDCNRALSTNVTS
jgi:hypothetical protein